jgi:hypothetical protein
MKRFLMALALAGAMIGCGDDDGDDDVDPGDGGGQAEGGIRNDGGLDGSMDARVDAEAGSPEAGSGGAIMCGALSCTPHMPNALINIPAACGAKNAAGADVCGLSTAPLGGADAGLPAVLEKNAPGVASAACGAAVDSFELGAAKGNGRIDSTVAVGAMSYAITYPGCCTPKGFCSGDTSMGIVLNMPSNGGFGCMEPSAFFAKAPALANIRCNPTSGALVIGDGGVGDGGTTTVTGMDSGL